MQQVQTVRFSNSSSNIASHNTDDFPVGSGSLSGNPQNSFVICSSEVVVQVDPTTHTSGSSAVATRNITNYPWELAYIPGNLVAVHSSGYYIAYAIKDPNSTNGIVRIISRRTCVRGIIKNIPTFIKDLSFAYLSSRILLAFIDQFCTLFVYEIHEEEGSLRTQLLVEVKRSESEEASDYQRVIWCPFIPDESADDEQDDGDDENFAYLLVVINGPLAEIWHVMTLMHIHGTGCIERAKVQLGSGYQVMEKHSAPISDAAFSPDGTALATASLDGFVKFFQIYMSSNQNTPRCLHQWNPHDGKPLSCLFFLDNHKNPSPDVQFWKYAVTGACNNTEIKTWSCESWHCNQVISFKSTQDSALDAPNLSLKAAIDPSSNYLILSDIYRRVLYVLIVNQEPASSEKVNGDALEPPSPGHGSEKKGIVRIISISELPIQYPAIFLAITDAEWKPYKRWKHEHPGEDCFQKNDEADEDNDVNDIVDGLVLKCILINTKSLQDATIRFQPVLPLTSGFNQLCSASSNHNLSLSQDSVVLKDGLTDLSINLSATHSELENSLNKSLMSRQTSDDAEVLESINLLSFSSKVSTGKAGDNHTSSPSATVSSTVLSSLTSCVLGDTKTAPVLTSPTGMNSVDCTTSNQPLTMNLLTPESFSSGRINDEDLMKESELNRACSEPPRVPKSTPSPSEDLKSAALSLLLRVGSGSCLPSPDTSVPGTSITNLHTQSTKTMFKTGMSNDIASAWDTVISGSSKSPITTLPPPPKSSPLMNSEDAPLATSEVADSVKPCLEATSSNLPSGTTSLPHVGSGIGLASSTSSPSLEVQQILHSHNIKNEEDYADEDEVGMEGNEVLGVIDSEGEKVSESLIDLPQSSPFVTSTQSPLHHTPPQSVAASQLLSGCPATQVPASSPLTPSGVPMNPLMNGSQMERESSQSNSLQELINITAGSKMESQKQLTQSPLIDMFAGLKNFAPPCSSHLTHLMDPERQQTSPLCDTSVLNVSKLCEEIPTSSMAFGPKDSIVPLPLFKNITVGKKHMTCEELEAEIKCASPTQKKVSKSSGDFPSNNSSSNSLSTLIFPMNLDGTNGNQNSMKVQTEAALHFSESEVNRYEKSIEEITSLRQLILSCDHAQEERLKSHLSLTKTLASQVDKTLKNMHQMNKSIEEIRKNQSKLHDSIPHLVTASAKPIIENSIRQELRNALTPALNKCMEPIRSHLSVEIRNLVANSESHMTDSLTKAACSRTFIDNVSASVAIALSASVQAACRDAYNKVVVPGFNAITQQVFLQLNEAFTRGTKEYMQHVESESQSLRSAVLDNINSSSRSLETTSSTLSSHVTVLVEALHKNITQQTTLSETLGDRLRHFVHDEIARALQEHHAAVEARTSRAQTPAPSGAHTQSNPKIARQQVQQLLSQEQFNLAFKQALSASDLSLVVFVCERINPQQLFSQIPCPLSQDVLLSLVNQLAHDLTTFTDLKTKYLEEAVMNLDTAHPVTREHMRKVLQELQRSLSTYLELNPNHKKLKMLLLAVNHLVAA